MGDWVNRVDYQGETLIDISDTTATEEDVAEGKRFYKSTGEPVLGSGIATDSVTIEEVSPTPSGLIAAYNLLVKGEARGDRIDIPNNGAIKSNPTSVWNSYPQLQSEENVLYVYTDYETRTEDEETIYIPGFKVGDGNSYLIDLPFSTLPFEEHVADTVMHITNAERTAWNNKVRCYISPTNAKNLVFTTN